MSRFSELSGIFEHALSSRKKLGLFGRPCAESFPPGRVVYADGVFLSEYRPVRIPIQHRLMPLTFLSGRIAGSAWWTNGALSVFGHRPVSDAQVIIRTDRPLETILHSPDKVLRLYLCVLAEFPTEGDIFTVAVSAAGVWKIFRASYMDALLWFFRRGRLSLRMTGTGVVLLEGLLPVGHVMELKLSRDVSCRVDRAVRRFCPDKKKGADTCQE